MSRRFRSSIRSQSLPNLDKAKSFELPALTSASRGWIRIPQTNGIIPIPTSSGHAVRPAPSSLERQADGTTAAHLLVTTDVS
jgi:hypothetical protein